MVVASSRQRGAKAAIAMAVSSSFYLKKKNLREANGILTVDIMQLEWDPCRAGKVKLQRGGHNSTLSFCSSNYKGGYEATQTLGDDLGLKWSFQNFKYILIFFIIIKKKETWATH